MTSAPSPSAAPTEKPPAGPGFLPRLQRAVVGLAQDFWKDGAATPSIEEEHPAADAASAEPAPPVEAAPEKPKEPWHANPGEIAEKMWGEGWIFPGDELLSDMLLKPCELTKEKSLLDLSAGLGTRLRQTVKTLELKVTGLEPDADIAVRAMDLSVAANMGKSVAISTYDSATFSLATKYDCIVAREAFYHVQDKDKFFAAIAKCANPKTAISFTDYIIDPENRDKPSIKEWQAVEKSAAPLGLVEMAEAWAKIGFKLEIHDDQTDFYRKEVMRGVKRFAAFIADSGGPDAATKAGLLRELQLWTLRMKALQDGMKLYRFYGTNAS